MLVTTSQEFVVRSCARSPTVIRSASGRPEEDELVRAIDRRSRDVGHVGHHGVHGHVPDERHAHAADQAAQARFDSARDQPSP